MSFFTKILNWVRRKFQETSDSRDTARQVRTITSRKGPDDRADTTIVGLVVATHHHMILSCANDNTGTGLSPLFSNSAAEDKNIPDIKIIGITKSPGVQFTAE